MEEASPAEREQHYQRLFHNILHGYAYCRVVHDASGLGVDCVFLEVNEAFGRITGLAGVVGRPASEVLRGISPTFFQRLGRVASGEPPEGFEHEAAAIGKWLHVSAYCPRPGHVVTMFDDITARKRAEASLRESELRLSLVLEGSAQGAWDWVVGTPTLTVSRRWLEIAGVAAEDGEDTSDAQRWIAAIHPDDRPRVTTGATELVSGRLTRYDFEYRLLGADGVWRWVHSLASAVVRNPDGIARRIAGTLADITSRKRSEELLRASGERDLKSREERSRLEAQLQQAQKMESVGRLAGGIAHDFNNMLGVILGHTAMALERVDPGQPLHADLREILEAARRSAALTRQLLAFARKQTISPVVLDLNATVAGMLNMLQRLLGEDIRLTWRPGAGLWAVKMDPSQIDQLLANLCVNARDAITDLGTLTIETDNVTLDEAACASQAEATPGDYVRLVVRDSGCGMTPEIISHLFEPFFTTKAQGKGTGLGLATLYGIVKQNDGHVQVRSEPGAGSEFTIFLPRHRGPLAAGLPVAPAAPGRETILLVEDEPAILKVAKRMLGRLGYVVLAAGSPGEALRVAAEHAGRIDLLMTDVVMPEMNGRELARSLLDLRPHLARLFMSGYTADVIAHKGVLPEGVNFIQKPFSAEELATAVRAALEP